MGFVYLSRVPMKGAIRSVVLQKKKRSRALRSKCKRARKREIEKGMERTCWGRGQQRVRVRIEEKKSVTSSTVFGGKMAIVTNLLKQKKALSHTQSQQHIMVWMFLRSWFPQHTNPNGI